MSDMFYRAICGRVEQHERHTYRATDDVRITCSGQIDHPVNAKFYPDPEWMANLQIPAPDDMVNHPPHYTAHPSGVECITITEHMGFNVGNAIKYLWRADEKGDALEDLKKAAWYVNREIERRTKGDSK